jgi:hypothetical protein
MARLSAQLPNGVKVELECSRHDATLVTALIAALHLLCAILPASIQPHIRLALCGFARLLQHLNGCFVAMDQWLRQQGLA